MPKKIFCFSIDDGNVEDEQIVRELNRYGFRGTFNLNSGRFGNYGLLSSFQPPIHHKRLSKEDALSIYQGHEINVHTTLHHNLVSCTEEEIVRFIEEDHQTLSDLFHQEIIGMAYPGGAPNNDARVQKIVREQTSMQYARSAHDPDTSFLPPKNWYEWDYTSHLFNPELPVLLDQYKNTAFEEDRVFVLFFHGFNFQWPGEKYDLPVQDTWQWFSAILEKLSHCPFDFMTMSEAYQYLHRSNPT